MTEYMRVGIMTVVVAASAMIAAGDHSSLTSPPPASARPFAPGERLSYDVFFGPAKVGTGSMEVNPIDTVRARTAYHTTFRLTGAIPLYRVDDVFESWFDTTDLSSLRFHQNQNEGQKERTHRYEIFPERRVYDDLTDDKKDQPSVAQPLDDGSFVYFVRTLPLEVGHTYELERYFKPERNPVTIRVVRRERVTVPAGTFDAIVIQPVINTKGIFSKDGEAELWISDDDRRMIVQMKSQLSFGAINLYLTGVRRP